MATHFRFINSCSVKLIIFCRYLGHILIDIRWIFRLVDIIDLSDYFLVLDITIALLIGVFATCHSITNQFIFKTFLLKFILQPHKDRTFLFWNITNIFHFSSHYLYNKIHFGMFQIQQKSLNSNKLEYALNDPRNDYIDS